MKLTAVAPQFTIALALLLACANAYTDSQIHGKVTLIDKNGEIKSDHSNVVVFLEGFVANSTTVRSQVSQKGKVFSPRVLAVQQGTRIDFLNDDDIFHNVFSVSKAKPFDLGIYAEGTSKQVVFDRPGLVKIYCNIHPQMVSNILVLHNSHFAVTDADGTFVIKNVPSGHIKVRVWHEFSDETSSMLEIKTDESQELNFELVESKRFKQHRNKFGKPYKSKY